MLPKKNYRNEQEWLLLINECRKSGFSDQTWCNQNGIPISTFYNKVAKLRKKACVISEASRNQRPHPTQQVVPVQIIEEVSIASTSDNTDCTLHSTKVPAITLTMNGCKLDIHSHADKDIILNTLFALQQLC
jgi:hypothetical protein